MKTSEKKRKKERNNKTFGKKMNINIKVEKR